MKKMFWFRIFAVTTLVILAMAGCPSPYSNRTVDVGDTRRELTPGSPVSVAADATSANVQFTNAAGLRLFAEDFTVIGGAQITSAAVAEDTVTVSINFAANEGPGAKTYTVAISAGRGFIKGDASVTVTQNDPGDTRKSLTAGNPVSVEWDATSAGVYFIGAAQLELSASDFIVSGGAEIVEDDVNVTGNDVIVTIEFEANTTNSIKTYIVSINPLSEFITGDASVTVTHHYYEGETEVIVDDDYNFTNPLGVATVSYNINAVNTAPMGNSYFKVYGEAVAAKSSPPAVAYPKPTPKPGGRIFHVAANGDDANDGLTVNTPWRTIQKVNSMTYQRNDQILFRAGDRWDLDRDNTRALSPKGDGLVIGAYGNGPKPKLWSFTASAGADVASAVWLDDIIFLLDSQDIEIRDLDIQNNVQGYTGADTGAVLRQRHGIRIAVSISQSTQKALRGYHIHNNYIHEVAGSSHGVSNGAPWDITKRAGGIYFETVRLGSNGRPIVPTKPEEVIHSKSRADDQDTNGDNISTTGFQPAWFEDIKIEKNVLQQNAFFSISFKQLSTWGVRPDSSSRPDYNRNNWYPHKYIYIQDNFVDHAGWERAADGFYLTNIMNVLVRRNTLYRCGTSSIEMYSNLKFTRQLYK